MSMDTQVRSLGNKGGGGVEINVGGICVVLDTGPDFLKLSGAWQKAKEHTSMLLAEEERLLEGFLNEGMLVNGPVDMAKADHLGKLLWDRTVHPADKVGFGKNRLEFDHRLLEFATVANEWMSTCSIEEQNAYKTKLTSRQQQEMVRERVRATPVSHRPGCVRHTKTAAHWNGESGKFTAHRTGFSKNWDCNGCRVHMAELWMKRLADAFPEVIEHLGQRFLFAASIETVSSADLASHLRKRRGTHGDYGAFITGGKALVVTQARWDDGLEHIAIGEACSRVQRWLEQPFGNVSGTRRVRSSKGWLPEKQNQSDAVVFDCTLEEMAVELRKLDPQANVELELNDGRAVLTAEHFSPQARAALDNWFDYAPEFPAVPPADILYMPPPQLQFFPSAA